MEPIISSTNAFKKNLISADINKETRLRQACADFEAMMLQQMMRMARENMPKSGLLEGGFAEDMFRSVQEEELAKNMSQGRGMGFGELLYRQISQQINPKSDK